MAVDACPAPVSDVSVTIIIPTYRREVVLIDTLQQLLKLTPAADEIIVVDQTERHEPPTRRQLQHLHASGAIRWLQRDPPSIPAAMNAGLLAARSAVVLFLDDDIRPDAALIEAHRQAQAQHPGLVAGQVLQPGQQPVALGCGERFRFNSTAIASIDEFMGGNFSVRRDLALALGGFDENFIGAAFRFEAEFACRYRNGHGPICFFPRASIFHLAIPSGGTRSYGYHYRTASPAHAVGTYYYLMRCQPRYWIPRIIWRPFRSVRTRFHLRHPWWIPFSLLAEARGFCMALQFCARGPRLIRADLSAASA